MMRGMDIEEAGTVILGALRLAKERVTGELDEKERRRERLADLIVRMPLDEKARPTQEDLTEALGNPDDGKIRAAISIWQ
jgi:hypothetical protein